MPRGERGEYRPADLIGCAIMTAQLATGEIEEHTNPPSGRTRSGVAGGKARAKKLTAKQRSAIAKNAAKKRWE